MVGVVRSGRRHASDLAEQLGVARRRGDSGAPGSGRASRADRSRARPGRRSTGSSSRGAHGRTSRRSRSRGLGCDYETGGWFNHVRLGWNYRWTDVQAAIGIGHSRTRPDPGAPECGGRPVPTELLAEVGGVSTLRADDAEPPALAGSSTSSRSTLGSTATA